MTRGIKRLAYRAGVALARLGWRARGGRRLRVLGAELRLHPQTTFPHYLRLPLPAGSFTERIVRYGDFVQMHAVAAVAAGFGERPVAVDVGAHHGAYALVLGAAARARGGVVLAFEPDPASFAVLVDNVRRNGLERTVLCQRAAVGDVPGSAFLRSRATESHVVRGGAAGDSRVELVTLRAALAHHGVAKVDLLMIDVEGAELQVLGGFPWGEVAVGALFCEMHPYAWRSHGYGPREVEAFLRERRLRCVDAYLREHRTFAADGYVGPTRLFEA